MTSQDIIGAVENKNIFKLFAIYEPLYSYWQAFDWTNFAADKKLSITCVDFFAAKFFDDVDKEYIY